MADRPPPSTANVAIASALVAGVTGYLLGQAKSLGLFGGSPISKGKADDSDSEDEDTELNQFDDRKEECKMVLVVRTDLGMTKGDYTT